MQKTMPMLNPRMSVISRSKVSRRSAAKDSAALPQVVREDSAISTMVESHKATPLDVLAQVRNTSFQTCEITGIEIRASDY